MYVPVCKAKNLFKLNNLCSKMPFFKTKSFSWSVYMYTRVYPYTVQCQKNSCISHQKTYRWGVFFLKMSLTQCKKCKYAYLLKASVSVYNREREESCMGS